MVYFSSDLSAYMYNLVEVSQQKDIRLDVFFVAFLIMEKDLKGR